MQLFKTSYSTLSAAALNEHIQAKYGLENTYCKYLIRGVSDTYKIEGNGYTYILKIYRNAHRSFTEIAGEVELLNILKNRGAKVAFPIKDLAGNQIQEFLAAEGNRYGVLYSFAEGKVVYDLNWEQLKILGREMAFNHNITSSMRLQNERKEYDINSTILVPLKTLESAFIDYPEGYNYMKTVAGKAIEKIESFRTDSFSKGYCHFDYLPKNFHFDKNNQLRVFDFDFAGKGLLVNDIMSFQVHYFFHVIIKGMPKEEADKDVKIFLGGYRELRDITE